ncbi:histidine triad nucleotide-binding protein [Peptoniphilus lacrimalis]|uniref:HIT-like protein HI_0961 n=1 Tax=Peptoniphilus lacrimalis TaxID=33031 RepID=A0A379C4S8_9FIRM|nr:histidine triad nucleotide-binding protein [Peptoniphilus lacrimalis]SUB56616.1 HIT-like protein HI_0961 [Peptoniphilus lacrimalis]
MDCLFCNIVKGQIPSEKVYEDNAVYAFKDVNPEAPVHILIIPKRHIKSVDELEETDKELVGHIFLVAKKLAKENKLENGYRIVSNIGEEGGQSVKHLHFHLLGGRSFNWPPG